MNPSDRPTDRPTARLTNNGDDHDDDDDEKIAGNRDGAAQRRPKANHTFLLADTAKTCKIDERESHPPLERSDHTDGTHTTERTNGNEKRSRPEPASERASETNGGAGFYKHPEHTRSPRFERDVPA